MGLITIRHVKNPWRDLLSTPASFRGVMFHVETGARISGRRVVLHEYPKRNDPYAEDMGRHARRLHFSGYLIYRPWTEEDKQRNPIIAYDYVARRQALIDALEEDDPGLLVHPVFARKGPIMVMCERYTVVETRERGGFTQFEMQFVESGLPANYQPTEDTGEKVKDAASALEDAAKTSIVNQMA